MERSSSTISTRTPRSHTDGKTITVEWPEGKGKGHARVSIPAGKHQVQVSMNGVQVAGQGVTVTSGHETRFKVNYIAPSSRTTDQTKKEQAGKPPEPPAGARPTVPTDAKLFAGKHYKAFKEFLSWHQAARSAGKWVVIWRSSRTIQKIDSSSLC